MSPDLKLATVAVMPLGGKDAEKTIAALTQHRKELRTLVAHRVNLKYAPDLRFVLDPVSMREPNIDALLRSPEVARDLGAEKPRRTIEPGSRKRRTSAAEGRPAPPGARRPRREPRRSTRVEVNGWINLDKPVGVTSTQAVGAAQVPVQRQEGRPCRNARSARLRRAADRVRRGDQDRSGRPGRREGLPFRGQVGRGDRHRRRRGPGDRRQRKRGPRQPRSRRVLPTSSASSCRRRRCIRRSRSPANAPTIWRATARVRDRAARDRRASARPRRRPMATARPSRPNAARAPMCARMARDLGRALGCYGHVAPLRRTRVGPFLADQRRHARRRCANSPEARAGALLSGRGRPFGAGPHRHRPQRRRYAAARPKTIAARLGGAGRGAGLCRLPGLAGRCRRGRRRDISSRRACSICPIEAPIRAPSGQARTR